MKRIEYLTNQKVGKLIFIEEAEQLIMPSGGKKRRAIFECYCGKRFNSIISHVSREKIISCGCEKAKIAALTKTTHGQSGSRLYRVWRSMKERTLNKNSKSFKNYGGRGIRVCKEWEKNFGVFFQWSIKNGYSESLTIDRIDNNGNYEPSNCRWASRVVQARNTRKIRSTNTSGYRGVSKTKEGWASRIMSNREAIHLGTFQDKESAALAYDSYVIENNLEHTRNFSA